MKHYSSIDDYEADWAVNVVDDIAFRDGLQNTIDLAELNARHQARVARGFALCAIVVYAAFGALVVSSISGRVSDGLLFLASFVVAHFLFVWICGRIIGDDR